MAEAAVAAVPGQPRGRALPRAARRAGVLFGTGWRAAPGLMATCTAAAFGAGLLGLVYPLGFRAVVDGAQAHSAARVLAGVVLVAVAFPGAWALQIAGAGLNSRLTDAVNVEIGHQIGTLVNAAPFLEHFERPDHLAQIEALRERRRTLAGAPAQVLGLARSAIQFTGAAVLLALMWPPLVVVPALAFLPALADRRAAAVEKRSEEEGADERRLLGALFALASSAGPARELRTFGATAALIGRHEQLGEEVNRRSLRAARLSAAWESAGWVVYAAGFAASVVVLVLRATHGAATAGDVVAAVSLLRRSQRQMSGAAGYAGSFSAAQVAAQRMTWLEDYVAAATVTRTAPAPARLEAGIALEHVSFSYHGQDAAALSDVSLSFPAGSVVAVVGENGAGKSTLVKLLAGLYRPDSGRVTVDGADLDALDPAAWRRAVTATFQDFVQLQAPLSDGVGAGDLPRIDDLDAVAGALSRADAGDLAAGLPDGLATLLGAYVRGRSLSGGQWQRVALARGLMRQAPLLVVLDEPTASLDAPTEAALFARYREAARRLAADCGTVTVLVSHRFSTVHLADQVVVLDGGRVAETGSHSELMGAGGLYAELFALQARGYAGAT